MPGSSVLLAMFSFTILMVLEKMSSLSLVDLEREGNLELLN